MLGSPSSYMTLQVLKSLLLSCNIFEYFSISVTQMPSRAGPSISAPTPSREGPSESSVFSHLKERWSAILPCQSQSLAPETQYHKSLLYHCNERFPTRVIIYSTERLYLGSPDRQPYLKPKKIVITATLRNPYEDPSTEISVIVSQIVYACESWSPMST